MVSYYENPFLILLFPLKLKGKPTNPKGKPTNHWDLVIFLPLLSLFLNWIIFFFSIY